MFPTKRFSVTGQSIRSLSAQSSAGIKSRAKSAETASMGYGFAGMNLVPGAAANVSVGGPTFSSPYGELSMLEGILPDQVEQALIKIYRNIYYYDPVGGSACDLISTFPFSEYTLSGLDPKEISVFSDSLARLNLSSILPEMTLRYLVDGDMIASLIVDPKTRTFADILIHDKLFSTIIPSPFEGLEPVIHIDESHDHRRYWEQAPEYMRKLSSVYGSSHVKDFQSGRITLDPVRTLFMSRKGMDRYKGGISFLKRILPIYLLERTLYRGTVIEAMRRQRSTTHVMAGDDTWEPSDAELEALLAQVQATDAEPLGAWLVTRAGVQVSDIRNPQDLWKWTDTFEQLTPAKLRALSISEAFLSAEANYSNAETGLTVFLENTDNYRRRTTYHIFTRRIFPGIAIMNKLYKKDAKIRETDSVEDLMFNMNNQKDLLIPKLEWNKDLNGSDSSTRIEILERMDEKGFPIPLKQWAVASGVSPQALLGDLDEDIELRKRVAKYKAKVEAIGADVGDESGSDSTGPEADYSGGDSEYAELSRVGLGRRSFNRSIGQRSKTGKLKMVANESRFLKKENDAIVKAAKALEDPHVREQMRKRIVSKLGGIPNIIG